MAVKKRNFVKKSQFNFDKKDGFTTMFHMSLSSKAVFGLSEGALKLYVMFVLHGKRNPPTVKLFANRMGKSERTISRYYEELKEKGFLKLTCLRPKVYKYEFDFNGNVNYDMKEEKIKFEEEKEIEKEVMEVLKQEKIEEEIKKEEEKIYLQKAKTIEEYEDFAVLENIYWTVDKSEREKIFSILKLRMSKEPKNKEVIKWFLDKVEYA